MIFIIDVAKRMKDELDNVSREIIKELYIYKNEFEIGVTDAGLSKDEIELTLETMVSRLKLEEDNGLSISATIGLLMLPEKKNNYFINIDIILFKSNGAIIESKHFMIESYGNIEHSEEIIQNALNYTKYLGEQLGKRLLNDYINIPR
jgi:hypothetical protein